LRIERLGEGRYHDGHGLYLLVTQTGGASWAYHYKVNGKERWMGLGGLYDVNLDEARERHWNARQLLKMDKVAALDKRKAERDARAWPRSGGLSLIRCLPITSFRQIITYSLSFAGTLWKLAGLRS
jgi:hypothetical protein